MSKNDVDSMHPEFARARGKMMKVRDFVDGEEAVKARGATYLPNFFDRSDDYHAYKSRAMFYGAAGRTVQALVGALFRKGPQVTWPDSRAEMLKTVGRGRKAFDEIAAKAAHEVLGPGRYGLLIDAPKTSEGEPYIAAYRAEDITNWEEAEIDGRMVPVRIHLREEVRERDPEKTFSMKLVEQYRILMLGAPALNTGDGAPTADEQLNAMGLRVSDLEKGVYFQQVWRENQSKDGSSEKWVLHEQVVPKAMGGRVLNEIPFVAINPSGTGMAVENSPMLGLVNVNRSHYEGSADLEHGRHLTAIPTPCAAGFDLEENETLRVGGSEAWVSDNPAAKAWYLEFGGSGLGHIAAGQAEKEKLMGVLGGRLLEQQPKGVEAEGTVKIRQAGDHSVLSMIADSVSEGCTLALRLLLWWIDGSVNAEELASYVLSTDFQVGMDPKLRADLIQLWQSNGITQERLLTELQRGEALGDDMDIDEELAKTEQDDAGLVDLPPSSQPSGEDDGSE